MKDSGQDEKLVMLLFNFQNVGESPLAALSPPSD